MVDAPVRSVTSLQRRAPAFAGIPDRQWFDWRWQLSHRLETVDQIGDIITLTQSEKEGMAAGHRLRVAVTPYFISLMDPNDPHDPLRRQVIPTREETIPYCGMEIDALAEEAHSPLPGLVHRYPDRVLMLITTQCPSYCRYCTRGRLVGDDAHQFNSDSIALQLEYIRRTPQIRDVLISGGDPFIVAPAILEQLLIELRKIEHVEVIRIGTRVPVFMPMRIDDALCQMLQKYHPIWVNIHCNHPAEITPEMARAIDRLTRVGIPVGSQAVLLAGINDCVHIQRALVHELVKIRVRPYYLYQCDLVKGGGHFRTPVAKGIEIMEGLIGHTSGYAVPTFVVDAPGGGGKIPVTPNYLVSQSGRRVVLRNYEGLLTTYQEPGDYQPHDPATCLYCQHGQVETGQSGVLGLLSGDQTLIKPTGFDQTHARGRNGNT